jgi:hypothetical protein
VIRFTPDTLKNWRLPDFQRPIKINEKVRALAEQLKADGGVMPGIITLGIIDGATYLIDGQHRREAFMISALEEGYTDVRMHYFESMADAGEEFVRLNSQLVRMRPDDILRGLEASVPALVEIRRRCPFVGYDMIRRGPTSPIVSMSMVLRAWRGSSTDVPSPHGVAASASSLAQTLTDEEARPLIDFLTLAAEGFGRDPEYARLWGSLNVILCMWLYRRMVLSQYSPKTPRLTKEQFKKCMMSLSANEDYLDWLVGRHLGERDRSPAYNKIKTTFAQRIDIDTGKKPLMPSPAWSSHSGGRR